MLKDFITQSKHFRVEISRIFRSRILQYTAKLENKLQ